MKADVLRVGGLAVPARIGWTAEERAKPQTLALDLEIHLHTKLAAAKDDLAATIDYAEAAAAAARAIGAREHRLLESAAEAAADAVLALGASRVRLRLRKRDPPMTPPAAFAEIEIERP